MAQKRKYKNPYHQTQSELGYAYIDSIIDNAVNDRISGFDSRRRENSEARAKTRSLLKNGDDEDLDFDSDADTASDDHDDRPPPRGAEWNPRGLMRVGNNDRYSYNFSL